MDKFILNNQIEKVLRGENTNFLNLLDSKYVVNQLRKLHKEYKVFKLFEETEKVIIYKDYIGVTLFEIKTKSSLTHKEILGALFSHNLDNSLFGDIVISDKYYICILDKIKPYIINNFDKIGNKKIQLEERDLNELQDFTLKFQNINLNVSSLRIDNIISKLIPTSRINSKNYIKNKKVLLNYNFLVNNNYILKENDVFSIRGIGKFKFIKVVKINKNNKCNILIQKYN